MQVRNSGGTAGSSDTTHSFSCILIGEKTFRWNSRLVPLPLGHTFTFRNCQKVPSYHYVVETLALVVGHCLLFLAVCIHELILVCRAQNVISGRSHLQAIAGNTFSLEDFDDANYCWGFQMWAAEFFWVLRRREMPTICVLLSFVLLHTSGPYD